MTSPAVRRLDTLHEDSKREVGLVSDSERENPRWATGERNQNGKAVVHTRQ
jgi:hypothetical protein